MADQYIVGDEHQAFGVSNAGFLIGTEGVCAECCGGATVCPTVGSGTTHTDAFPGSSFDPAWTEVAPADWSVSGGLCEYSETAPPNGGGGVLSLRLQHGSGFPWDNADIEVTLETLADGQVCAPVCVGGFNGRSGLQINFGDGVPIDALMCFEHWSVPGGVSTFLGREYRTLLYNWNDPLNPTNPFPDPQDGDVIKLVIEPGADHPAEGDTFKSRYYVNGTEYASVNWSADIPGSTDPSLSWCSLVYEIQVINAHDSAGVMASFDDFTANIFPV